MKSLRGLSHRELVIEIDGPAGDREFMVVGDDGRFLTQRQISKMATIAVTRVAQAIRLEADGRSVSGSVTEGGEELDVVVWGDTVRARTVSADIDAFLTEVLGRSVRLVRYQPSHLRVKSSAGGDEFSMRFPDSSQILLTTMESTKALADHVGQDLPANRYRPNILIEGFPAWTEESFKGVRIGDLEFEIMKPATRCKIITIDQQTGVVGSPAPLVALKDTVKGAQPKATFGMHLRVLRPGVLRAGDVVEFL